MSVCRHCGLPEDAHHRFERVDGLLCDIRKGDHPNPLQRVCDRPAVLRYPAMGGGYMLLCAEYGAKHQHYCEQWDGTAWHPAPPSGQRGEGAK